MTLCIQCRTHKSTHPYAAGPCTGKGLVDTGLKRGSRRNEDLNHNTVPSPYSLLLPAATSSPARPMSTPLMGLWRPGVKTCRHRQGHTLPAHPVEDPVLWLLLSDVPLCDPPCPRPNNWLHSSTSVNTCQQPEAI